MLPDGYEDKFLNKDIEKQKRLLSCAMQGWIKDIKDKKVKVDPTNSPYR